MWGLLFFFTKIAFFIKGVSKTWKQNNLSSCILVYMPEACTVDMSLNLETRDKMPSKKKTGSSCLHKKHCWKRSQTIHWSAPRHWFWKSESSWCSFTGLLSIRPEKEMIISVCTGEASSMQKCVPLGTVLQQCPRRGGKNTETIFIMCHWTYRFSWGNSKGTDFWKYFKDC